MTDYTEPLTLAKRALRRVEECSRAVGCGHKVPDNAHQASVALAEAVTQMQRIAEWLREKQEQ